jgi:hypothetical protein
MKMLLHRNEVLRKVRIMGAYWWCAPYLLKPWFNGLLRTSASYTPDAPSFLPPLSFSYPSLHLPSISLTAFPFFFCLLIPQPPFWVESNRVHYYSGQYWPIVPAAPDDNECGAIGGMIGRGIRSTWRKPAPVLICLPQIPHDLSRARTRTAAEGSRRLTAWAKARPIFFLLPKFYSHLPSSIVISFGPFQSHATLTAFVPFC